MLPNQAVVCVWHVPQDRLQLALVWPIARFVGWACIKVFKELRLASIVLRVPLDLNKARPNAFSALRVRSPRPQGAYSTLRAEHAKQGVFLHRLGPSRGMRVRHAVLVHTPAQAPPFALSALMALFASPAPVPQLFARQDSHAMDHPWTLLQASLPL